MLTRFLIFLFKWRPLSLSISIMDASLIKA
jgi:hypothetical protein